MPGGPVPAQLEARLIAVGMAVIPTKGQLALHGGRSLMPEPLDRRVINARVYFVQQNPSQFTIPKSVIAGFEMSQFLHHCFRDRLASAWDDDLSVRRQ
jgi:hypothetical protein